MTNALSYSSSVRFEGMLRRVLDPLAEEARKPTRERMLCVDHKPATQPTWCSREARFTVFALVCDL